MMRKKIRKLHSGFTIAELLAAMLVVMVVAAAMVPVIGPKKIKVPRIRTSHGLAECYWDVDGKLVYHQMSNNADIEPIRWDNTQAEHAGATSCTFHVPKAERYEIYAIGAGADGFKQEDVFYNITRDDNAQGGIITFKNFETDLSAIEAPMNLYTVMGFSGPWELGDAVKEAFNKWDANIYKQSSGNKRLWAQFKNVRSAIGDGGAGASTRIPVEKIWFDGGEKYCDALGYFGKDFSSDINDTWRTPYLPITGFITQNSTDVMNAAKAEQHCGYFVHGEGGRSGSGFMMSNLNNVLLFPLRGDSTTTYQDSGNNLNILTKTKEYKDLNGTTKTSKTANRIQSIGGTSNGAVPSYNASLGRFVLSNDYPDINNNGSAPLSVEGKVAQTIGSAYLSTGSYSGANTHPTFLWSRYGNVIDELHHRGATHGIQPANAFDAGGECFEGLAPGQTSSGCGGQAATPGSAEFNNDMFSWSYSMLKADCHYGAAGKAGDINVMIYNKLGGKTLYLFPGKHLNTEGTAASPTVVSLEQNPNIAAKRVLTANSHVNEDTASHQEFYISNTSTNYPPDDIIARATAQNDKLTYIDRISLSKMDSDLLNCKDNGNCPGYGGSGAYPIMTYVKGGNVITLRNNQTYKELNSYEQSYVDNGRMVEFGNKTSSPSCKDGSPAITKENSANITSSGEGWEVYSPSWCKTGNAIRRDGAVVIIW